ncbi:unnamed protein product [Acanthoscelides obtectus]|uniref:Uncharacterized protein n=1 Tax=Acanthoscelides obtectus TaxID=200917 RepID=A0A9P0LLX8_ACAOB|nr:unnamed protein product [Acanthoscelides obtectus]CAK1656346.1 hypothetical protein AOBTE_LOCUS19657 [Acanthoscelides obtectus]
MSSAGGVKHVANVQNDKGVRSVQSGVAQPPLIVIQGQRYHLNPSKSKWITIGRAYHWNFKPVINIKGLKTEGVTLNEEDWYEALNQEGIITNFFFSDDIFHPIQEHGDSRSTGLAVILTSLWLEHDIAKLGGIAVPSTTALLIENVASSETILIPTFLVVGIIPTPIYSNLKEV